MKKHFIYIWIVLVVALASCYDDLGNYDYAPIEEPVVTGMQVKMVAFVGDSITVRPTVKHSRADTEDFSYRWEISNAVDLRTEAYTGKDLHMLCNLKESIYPAKYIITDNSNGMKYFFPFQIEVRSDFTKGTLVLSNVGGVAQLSFIKPGEIILPNIYEGLHGEPLPKDPKQLFYIMAVPGQDWYNNYFVVCGEPDKPGVMLNMSTLFRKRYLGENFFSPPSQLHAGLLTTHGASVPTGVFDGKLYMGAYTTAPFSPVFGKFGDGMPGDYTISEDFLYYRGKSCYLGFEINRRQLVQFGAVGDYMGTNYDVENENDLPFNPKDIDKELVKLLLPTEDAGYAFLRRSDGVIEEAVFNNSPGSIAVRYFREFMGSSLVQPDTKWQASRGEIIYFSSGSNVYRYNPVNETLQTIEQDFGGKTITMLKLVSSDLLIAGVEGELYYLDVSTGKYGDLLKVVKNIPGLPVDLAVRE